MGKKVPFNEAKSITLKKVKNHVCEECSRFATNTLRILPGHLSELVLLCVSSQAASAQE
jgi:hypothetical protein